MTGIPRFFLKADQRKPLSDEEVEKISPAFLALARMDEGFRSHEQ